MRNAPKYPLLASVAIALSGAVFAPMVAAQTPVPSPASPTSKGNASGDSALRNPREKQGQSIRIEDSGAAIDEVRLGGETQSIQVQPKGGMPKYEVLPARGENNGGTRVWKVLGF